MPLYFGAQPLSVTRPSGLPRDKLLPRKNYLDSTLRAVPYLNSYMKLGRCDRDFPLDILTKTVTDLHQEANAKSEIIFKAVSRDNYFTYTHFSYVSKHEDYPKKIASSGGLMGSVHSTDCFGLVQ